MKEILKQYVDKYNIKLSDEQLNKFIIYKNNLCEWNEKINLTAITDEAEIAVKHFLDSLVVAKYINKGSNVIDVGTGAGFPGIPLKIFFDNNINLLLLDALNKRINFLQDTISKLNLSDVDALHGRAEDFGKDIKYREKYDIAVSRAVANLTALAEYLLPFVKVGGYALAMKGPDVEEEVNQAKDIIYKLGGKIQKIEKIKLPMDINHTIIIIKKERSTPKNFPRKQNEIKRVK